ncbi:uncharacterized protein LOC123525666 [Mercenaria mercenaria]|uniref:uncharacterized protein LOC123525666 n=1 Tax=Mercenaria mercenaria TaxID=6596 RepID=UPI00234F81DD|nr:uncharacterized protein LOC123525666 [Mercenaria mercenaria]
MAENTGKTKMDTVERPPLKKHDIKLLDLAFAMDCTGSMGSYIDSARDNIRKIVEEIVASEKSNVHLALVEYRDHPPEDATFVTRVHDFTASPKTMKEWLSNSQATGGGDCPEAVADALHDVLKLTWREEATKICVCISDAPPHGLNCSGDGFPNGCPAGIDPMEVTNRMAEKGITLYMVGCEPSITPYKDFFMAVAFITGGQYVPLTKAQLLTQVIVGGAQEEMSLEHFMDEVNAEAQADLAAGREIDEEEFTRRVHSKMVSKGIKTKQLHRNKAELSSVAESPGAKKLADFKNLSDVRKNFKPDSAHSEFGHAMPAMAHAPMAMRRSRGGPPMAMGGGPPMAMAMSAPPPPPGDAESYETVEADISYAQSSRMVQKCLKRNMIKK